MSNEPYQRAAKRYLDGYLAIMDSELGIKDTQVSISGNISSMVLGIRGPERAKSDGRVYYILPQSILVEINRESDGLEPHNPTLVNTINAVLDGSDNLNDSVVKHLVEHYESANAYAPGESPKPSYWDFLASMWPNIKPETQS